MRVLLTKLSPDRHRFTVVRDDGRQESTDVASRSLWAHDLLHYALERAAGIEDGFFGSLAAGRSLAELNATASEAMASGFSGLAMIERLTGPFYALVSGKADEDAVLHAAKQVCALNQTALPSWLTLDFIDRVKSDIDQLARQWKSLRIGGTMELRWPQS